MRYVSSREVAKAFGRYQDEALSDAPIAVTRYGRPTVVIVSYAEYEELRSGTRGRPPQREVFRAEELPDDLVAALEQAQAPDEATAFDHEVDRDGAA